MICRLWQFDAPVPASSTSFSRSNSSFFALQDAPLVISSAPSRMVCLGWLEKSEWSVVARHESGLRSMPPRLALAVNHADGLDIIRPRQTAFAGGSSTGRQNGEASSSRLGCREFPTCVEIDPADLTADSCRATTLHSLFSSQPRQPFCSDAEDITSGASWSAKRTSCCERRRAARGTGASNCQQPANHRKHYSDEARSVQSEETRLHLHDAHKRVMSIAACRNSSTHPAPAVDRNCALSLKVMRDLAISMMAAFGRSRCEWLARRQRDVRQAETSRP